MMLSVIVPYTVLMMIEQHEVMLNAGTQMKEIELKEDEVKLTENNN